MTDFLGNIKPDREERPKVDAIYQEALSPIKQQRGCPLTFVKTEPESSFGAIAQYPQNAPSGQLKFSSILKTGPLRYLNAIVKL